MKLVNFSDVRADFKSLLDQVEADQDDLVVTRRGAPDAVIMSKSRYDSLMETLHLLDSPANAAHLARSLEQARQKAKPLPE